MPEPAVHVSVDEDTLSPEELRIMERTRAEKRASMYRIEKTSRRHGLVCVDLEDGDVIIKSVIENSRADNCGLSGCAGGRIISINNNIVGKKPLVSASYVMDFCRESSLDLNIKVCPAPPKSEAMKKAEARAAAEASYNRALVKLEGVSATLDEFEIAPPLTKPREEYQRLVRGLYNIHIEVDEVSPEKKAVARTQRTALYKRAEKQKAALPYEKEILDEYETKKKERDDEQVCACARRAWLFVQAAWSLG